jgi:hypothetical protein
MGQIGLMGFLRPIAHNWCHPKKGTVDQTDRQVSDGSGVSDDTTGGQRPENSATDGCNPRLRPWNMTHRAYRTHSRVKNGAIYCVNANIVPAIV